MSGYTWMFSTLCSVLSNNFSFFPWNSSQNVEIIIIQNSPGEHGLGPSKVFA